MGLGYVWRVSLIVCMKIIGKDMNLWERCRYQLLSFLHDSLLPDGIHWVEILEEEDPLVKLWATLE
jgi:hypothetical protein